MRVAVIIPTFNEAESIGAVVASIPRDIADRVIVVDGGGVDGTADVARGAGAEVITVGRGYGRACLAARKRRTTRRLSCLWTAMVPTIPLRCPRWSRLLPRETTISSLARVRAETASPEAWPAIKFLPVWPRAL